MTTLNIPASCLYWGMINAPKRVRGHSETEAARFALEALLPVPIDEVEIRWFVVGDAKKSDRPSNTSPAASWIGCAIEHATLSRLLEESESSGSAVEHAVPSEWPACLIDGQPWVPEQELLHSLDFRSGSYASPRLLRRRRRQFAAIAALMCLATASWCAAWIGQSRMWRQEATQLRAQSAQSIVGVLGDPVGAAGSLEPALRLTAELRTMRVSRDKSATNLRSEDRLATYLGLLTHWPSDILTRTDSIQLDQDALSLRGMVKSPQDYETLNQSLRTWLMSSGWTTPAGSSAQSGDAQSFTLAARREPSTMGGQQ